MKTVFKARTGSHLYGLNTVFSDEDFVGVFLPDPEQLLGLQQVGEVSASTKALGDTRKNTSKDIDDKSYSLQKFLHLLLQNNPNIVELLFVPEQNVLIEDEVFTELRSNSEKIISQKVFHTFSGYAYAQLHKLKTKDLKKGDARDIKFEYHLIRLLMEGHQLLESGKLQFPFKGEDHETLLSIRKSHTTTEEVISLSERLWAMLEKAKEETSLPWEPNRAWANDWLVETTLKHLKTF